MRLMIVDDHSGVREMIRALVTDPEDEVCECVTADEAVQRAADFRPDYLTMDLWMPGLNSFKGIQAVLKASPATKVFVVTAYDQGGLRGAATEAGAVQYVLKENLSKLRELIRPGQPLGPVEKENPAKFPCSVSDLEPRLRSPLGQLSARVEELESFPAFAANELRSPLRTLENFTSLLQRQPESLTADGQACVRRISETCEQMHQRIDALLAFAEAGRREVKWETVALEDIVKQCWNQAMRQLPLESVQFRMFRLSPVQGDAGLLRLVFGNLLENAVKFSAGCPSPAVEVNCCDVGSHAVFAVTDNGVGFDMKHAGRLFLPLARLHSADKYPGGGLGLALTRRIVQQHGGRIWADSKVNQGTTFYFTLPRKVPEVATSEASMI